MTLHPAALIPVAQVLDCVADVLRLLGHNMPPDGEGA